MNEQQTKETSARQELIEALRTARMVQIGSTLFIGTAEEVQKAISKGLQKGLTIRQGNAVSWIETRPIVDPSKEGSDQYTWHPDGNRIRCEKLLKTQHEGRTIHVGFAGYAWVDFARAFED